MPTADLTHRQATAFSYTGALLDANLLPVGPLANLAATGVFDGGAPTGTGISIEAGDVASFFDLEITAAAMDVAESAVITISADGAQDLVLTIRTGQARRMSYGIPESKRDAQEGGICAETGLACPASRMKMLDGKRVADFVDFITPD